MDKSGKIISVNIDFGVGDFPMRATVSVLFTPTSKDIDFIYDMFNAHEDVKLIKPRKSRKLKGVK